LNKNDFCIYLISKLILENIDEINMDNKHMRNKLIEIHNHNFPFSYVFDPDCNFKVLYDSMLGTHRVCRYGNSLFFSITPEYAKCMMRNISVDYIDWCADIIKKPDPIEKETPNPQHIFNVLTKLIKNNKLTLSSIQENKKIIWSAKYGGICFSSDDFIDLILKIKPQLIEASEFYIGKRDAENGFSPRKSNGHYMRGYQNK